MIKAHWNSVPILKAKVNEKNTIYTFVWWIYDMQKLNKFTNVYIFFKNQFFGARKHRLKFWRIHGEVLQKLFWRHYYEGLNRNEERQIDCGSECRPDNENSEVMKEKKYNDF